MGVGMRVCVCDTGPEGVESQPRSTARKRSARRNRGVVEREVKGSRESATPKIFDTRVAERLARIAVPTYQGGCAVHGGGVDRTFWHKMKHKLISKIGFICVFRATVLS